jgi:transcriptional regulator with XRE-family HTH domain
LSFRSARKAAGLTQIEAAERIGVSQGSITFWENGLFYPRGKRLNKIASVYGTTIQELFAPDELK